MTTHSGKRRGLLAVCVLGTLLFSALGIWQIQRLAWKRDLIHRVETRIHLPPAAAPARSEWERLDIRDAEYRHVEARGLFRHDRETLVDALTVLGQGFWVLTPLETADGIILVNRGFVPRDRRDPATRAKARIAGQETVTGLLRATEPGGRILRANRPEADRWFSRDVVAIARVRGLEGVAPFFIDADAGSGSGDEPVGGLTVVRFRNAHLVYAITWFGLALMCLAGLIHVSGFSTTKDR